MVRTGYKERFEVGIKKFSSQKTFLLRIGLKSLPTEINERKKKSGVDKTT